MNSVNIIGRLVKDPEITVVSAEGLPKQHHATFMLAIDDLESPEDRSDTIKIIVPNERLAQNVGKYLRKGFLCGVTGKIRVDPYIDSEGVPRYPTGIIASRIQFLQWPETKKPPAEDLAPKKAGVKTVYTLVKEKENDNQKCEE